MTNYKVVNFRSCRSMEDDAYSFEVKKGRTLVAEFNYEGTGGPVNYHFFSGKDEKLFGESIFPEVKQYLIKIYSGKSGVEVTEHEKNRLAEVESFNSFSDLNDSDFCSYVRGWEWYAEMISVNKLTEKDTKQFAKSVAKKIHVVFEDSTERNCSVFKLAYNEKNLRTVKDYLRREGRPFAIVTPEDVMEYGINDVLKTLHATLQK